jgi:pimeloyl-ACP methyl ester carboxylesterase
LHAFPRHRVVAPDLPGYGATRRFRGPYTIDTLAAWVADFADAAGIGPGAVAGVSMGGAASIAYAVANPERVRALIPVAPFGMGGPTPLRRTLFVASRLPLTLALYGAASVSDRAVRRAMRNVWADLDRMPPDLPPAIRRAARVQLRTGSFLAFMKGETAWSGFRTDLTERVGAIRCPTLYVHGEEDRLIPARASERAAATTPGAEVALIPKAGHLPMRENPEATHAAMRAFLDGLG